VLEELKFVNCCFLLADVFCACERTWSIFSSTGWPDFKEKILMNSMENQSEISPLCDLSVFLE
jgi:hypothetical protein